MSNATYRIETWYSDCEFCSLAGIRDVKIYDTKYQGTLNRIPEGWKHVIVAYSQHEYYNDPITKLACPQCAKEHARKEGEKQRAGK